MYFFFLGLTLKLLLGSLVVIFSPFYWRFSSIMLSALKLTRWRLGSTDEASELAGDLDLFLFDLTLSSASEALMPLLWSSWRIRDWWSFEKFCGLAVLQTSIYTSFKSSSITSKLYSACCSTWSSPPSSKFILRFSYSWSCSTSSLISMPRLRSHFAAEAVMWIYLRKGIVILNSV